MARFHAVLSPDSFVGRRNRSAWRRRLLMLIKVSALVLAIGLAKLVAHQLGWEWMRPNPLVTSLVASTVFLMGFLLNGVLGDFKESEKLPGEIATSLETLGLEIQAIPSHNPVAQVGHHLEAVAELGDSILEWLLNRIPTAELLRRYQQTHGQVVQASVKLGIPPLQARLMAETAQVLKLINRVEAIRETSFITLVYWLATAGIVLLSGSLIFTVTDVLQESIFFILVIAFLLIFLLRLIADIDNPFGHADANSAEDVSIDLLVATVLRLKVMAAGARG
jgi:predicted membrane chloride channel (bestrophin family)